MSKRQESKYKINRRLGENLWGRGKSPINKREYGPGQHGQRRKKPSDYGTQLSAKQKLKGYYANIGERQFRRLYEEAVRRRGDTGENLIELLERRFARNEAIRDIARGDEWESPSIRVFHATFVPFATSKLATVGHASATPRPNAPWNDGQSRAAFGTSVGLPISGVSSGAGEKPLWMQMLKKPGRRARSRRWRAISS